MLARHKKSSPLTATLFLAFGLASNPWAHTTALQPRAQGIQAPSVCELRVENQSRPQGLDTTAPRFSWSILDSDRGASQSAYAILVASSAALLDANQGDLLDTKRVVSSEQLWIPYTGAPLSMSQRYYWKVRVWDNQNVRGPWSATGTFDLMPDVALWDAEYLWDGSLVVNNTAYLRTSFNLAQATDLGKVYVSAHEELSLWVNGTHVLFGPAPADPYFGLQLVALDVTPYLVVGENVFAARVYWDGGTGNAGVQAEPAFIFEADLDHADGTRTTLVSDSTWRVLAQTPFDESAPIRGPIFGEATTVEDFDARLEPVGWKDRGFDDSSWDLASVVQPGFQLRSQSVPASEVLEEIAAVSAFVDVASGATIVDFGRNVSGWISLRINTASAGDRITVHYSEEFLNNRIVRDRDGITNMWDAYICRGGGPETFEPDRGYLGFRYIEIEGYPGALSLSDVSLMRYGTPLKKLGSFCSSSTELAEVIEISIATQESCAQGILVDCPQREQTQHMTDAFIQGRNLASHFAESNLLAKCLRDIRDGSLGMGVLRSHHPSEKVKVIPEWTLSWIHAVEYAYLQTGDRQLLLELYPDLVAALGSFDVYSDPATGLLLSLPLPSYGFQGVDLTAPGLATLNCLYYEALRVGRDVAGILGMDSDQSLYAARAAALGVAIRANLFDGVNRYFDGIGSSSKSQIASALPILFGIETGQRARALAESVRSEGLTSGTVGGYYVARALRLFDFGDELLDIAVDENDEHWGKMLSLGATTTFEDWDGLYSLAHAWSGYPMAYAIDGLLGIAPLTPGWSQVEIRPRIPSSLVFARGSVPTPRGLVQVSWDQDATTRSLQLTSPPNMPALVSVPTGGLGNVIITEGGLVVFDKGAFVPSIEGIVLDGIEGDFVRFQLPPGTYNFKVSGVSVNTLASGSGTRIDKR